MNDDPGEMSCKYLALTPKKLTWYLKNLNGKSVLGGYTMVIHMERYRYRFRYRYAYEYKSGHIYIYILDIDIKKGIFRKKQPPITFPNLILVQICQCCALNS